MIKTIIIVALAVTTLGFLGSTIGLAVTRNNGAHKNEDNIPPPDPLVKPLCSNVKDYSDSFADIEGAAEQYIFYAEKEDADLLVSMMSEGTPFTSGKVIFADQTSVLNGIVFACDYLGRDCASPNYLSDVVTDRLALVREYSEMNYEQFLESQGIYN